MTGLGGSEHSFGFETRAIHAGQAADPVTGAVVPPISLSTTFTQSEVGVHQGFEYSRTGNPTRASLETQLASLEQGAWANAFASGMAAEDAILHLLDPGDHVLIPKDAYGGTFRLLDTVWTRFGVTYTPVDLSDGAAVDKAWRPHTKLVWAESPSNPLLNLVDISWLASRAHQGGALLVVDNTFATPYLQQPLGLGADLVVHSATKYLGGHSDVVGGAVVGNEEGLAERIAFFQNAAGAVPSPFDCYLVQRGLKTLGVRMDRAAENAAAVASLLSDHPAVSRVLYPGLVSHPGHSLAVKQMSGFGAMVSFVLAGGESAALRVCRSTRVFALGESLGAVESLIEHPHRMTHASAANSPLAVDPGLIRLSVGIETGSDLVADLRQALDSQT